MLTRLLLLFLLSLPAGIAAADPGTIEITDAWARATPPGLDVGAAYLVIHNRGSDDRLVRAASPVAHEVQFHRTVVHEGMARMREQPTVAVAAGRETVFAPGGMHVMLLGLTRPLAAGAHFPLTLTFERAGTLEVEVEVRGAGAYEHAQAHDPAHHHDAAGHDHEAGHGHDPAHGGGHPGGAHGD